MDLIKGNSVLDVFFSDETMSVHFKENTPIFKKVGRPGDWVSVQDDKIVTRYELVQLIDKLYKEIGERDDAFLEIDKNLSKVVQLGPYRVVIVHPPLSDGLEMTVVKPIKRLSLADYNLDESIIDLLKLHAQGILVSGAPGSGKTTFAQAIVDMYVEMHKVVKTLESPRDLMVPDNVVQYSFSYGSHNELRDILLLSRPDYTIYDEIRNHEDFDLYKDLRLTGVGMVGVIHATRPVDGIQRFLGTIELGVIPQVIDTVIFIDAGKVDSIYQLNLKVKVPSGMHSDDLARPVIEIKNFFTGALEYEIYSFGEQIVVIPLAANESGEAVVEQDKSVQFATRYLQDYFDNSFMFTTLVHLSGANSIKVYAPSSKKGNLIGKGGEKINMLEEKLGMSIQVKSFDDLPFVAFTPEIEIGKKATFMSIMMPKEFAAKKVSLLVDGTLTTLNCGPDAVITLTKKQLIRDIQTKGIRIVDHRYL